ncbi:MAG: hypothetical protein O2955_01795 [Planctomycetota bacterium]|nr:hypothetical protein [Planctomycetota bacterium]MDA1211216.1 hypothetical protein [Planctomycetota bacterium]
MKLLLILFFALIACTVGVMYTEGTVLYVFQFAFFGILGISVISVASGLV